jgi:hypothetical protein
MPLSWPHLILLLMFISRLLFVLEGFASDFLKNMILCSYFLVIVCGLGGDTGFDIPIKNFFVFYLFCFVFLFYYFLLLFIVFFILFIYSSSANTGSSTLSSMRSSAGK